MVSEAAVMVGPNVKVGGVNYVLTYGEGVGPYDELFGYGPVYVWRAFDVPDYVAPPHVQAACDEAYNLACEVVRAELAAGWDPNP